MLGGAEGAGQLVGGPQGGREEPDIQYKQPRYGLEAREKELHLEGTQSSTQALLFS